MHRRPNAAAALAGDRSGSYHSVVNYFRGLEDCVARSFTLAAASVRRDDSEAGTLEAIDSAAAAGADLVVLPEEPDIVAGREAGSHVLGEHPLFQRIVDCAREASVAVVGSLSVMTEPPVRPGTANTAFVVDADGELVGTYRKKHPAPGEEFIVTDAETVDGRQDPFPIFEVAGVKIAIGICMDIHFPEMFRIYSLKGAEIVCLPTMYLDYTGDMLESMEKARAADNQFYLAISRYIDEPYLAGKSMGYAKIIAPDARVIASTGHQTGLAVADVDPSWKMPFWGEGYRDMYDVFTRPRKPGFYTGLTDTERRT